MNAVIDFPTRETAVTSAFKVDTTKGGLDGRVSSQWYSRPDDQRFLSLDSLYDAVKSRSQGARQNIIDVSDIKVSARADDADRLAIDVYGKELTPTHWSFGQLATLAKAPAGYMRQLPATIAGINLQYGLQNLREENVKLYYNDDQIMAATGVDYGRVYDVELVEAVQKIAGNGTGDTRWKIPGVLDWSTSMYNPFVDPSKDTTTLYASDRDVFMFLVDDTHPIEIGKLANGEPDLVFRGFYVWNSEVGSKTIGISTFLLRAVCQNRNLWGQQGVSTLSIRHSKNAPSRFEAEVGPALIEYSNASDRGVIAGINQAKQAVVARSDDERLEFLSKRGFSVKQSQKIIDTVIREEDKKPESVWDFVNGITAVARGIGHTDDRITMERQAGDLLAKAYKMAA